MAFQNVWVGPLDFGTSLRKWYLYIVIKMNFNGPVTRADFSCNNSVQKCLQVNVKVDCCSQ